jgi:putative DNA primase/helicase
MWQTDRLKAPEKVKAATQAYRDEEDDLSRFIEEKLILNAPSNTQASELFAVWKEWAKDNNVEPGTLNSFGRKMSKRIGKAEKSNGINVYKGVLIRTRGPAQG